MKKRLPVIIILMLCTVILLTGCRVIVRVTDENGKPVPGATVTIKFIGKDAFSDESGKTDGQGEFAMDSDHGEPFAVVQPPEGWEFVNPEDAKGVEAADKNTFGRVINVKLRKIPGYKPAAVKQAQPLSISASRSGYLDMNKKQNVEEDTFYIYKNLAWGYAVFPVSEIPKDTIIESASLTLTKHPNSSASEAAVNILCVPSKSSDIGTNLTGSSSGRMSAQQTPQQTKPQQVKLSASAAAADTFDVSAAVQSAIDEMWKESDLTDIAFYFWLDNPSTEHSQEWFGANTNTPPLLDIQNGTK